MNHIFLLGPVRPQLLDIGTISHRTKKTLDLGYIWTITIIFLNK